MRQAACAVTGHRPSRFKFKYSEDYSLCKKIKRAMLEQFKRLYDEHGGLRQGMFAKRTPEKWN